MGFGTLFLGYFLLLDLPYYSFTDIIATSVMLLGLYKLSAINRNFKISAMVCAVFLLFSSIEFGIWGYELLFTQLLSPLAISIITIIRSVTICALTITMLLGISDVSKEVELDGIPAKSKRLIIFAIIVYSMWIISELPLKFINDYIWAIIALITVISTLAVIILNLILIYTCYMKICMPGQEAPGTIKQSRFKFVNEYRKRKAERDEELKKEQIEMLKQNNKKKGRKK